MTDIQKLGLNTMADLDLTDEENHSSKMRINAIGYHGLTDQENQLWRLIKEFRQIPEDPPEHTKERISNIAITCKKYLDRPEQKTVRDESHYRIIQTITEAVDWLDRHYSWDEK